MQRTVYTKIRHTHSKMRQQVNELTRMYIMKRQPKFFRFVYAAIFLVLPIQANAGTRFQPGATYYFDAFDPAQKPWSPGFDLNYEEVFKNYEYYEIVFSSSGKEFTVNRYLRNSKKDSEQYRLNPDGSISRIQPPAPPAAAN